MKRILVLLAAVVFAGSAFAQNVTIGRPSQTPAAKPSPLPTRQVSGIVKDSTDQAIIGAIVTLTSSADTLKASTNADGVFVFRNVKSWVFTLSVKYLGYNDYVKKGQYNDATARLTMDPVILKTASTNLTEIKLNGTPSIVYKTDTVEYRASDYVVRAGATVDELLKKMEGMEVSSDGTLTHNGQTVAKARLNGKDLYGGDMASVIQSLPAEIIEKAQIVDDYGDQAKRTGIKEGDATKVLNLTTRTDKSVGNMARLNAGAGTTDRYEGSVNLTRINGNQTIGLTINNISKYPNGIAGGAGSVGRLTVNRGAGRIAGGGGSGVSGGSTFSLDPRFSYRDNFGKKVELNVNYSFNYNNPDNLVDSYSQSYNQAKNPATGQFETFTTFATRFSENNNYGRSHELDAELEYNIDSSNYLQIRPNVRLNGSNNYGFSNTMQTGFIHQNQTNRSTSLNSTPTFGGTVAYQHVWLKKPARSFSLEATATHNTTDNDGYQYNTIRYFQGNTDNVLKDSIVNRLIGTDNRTNNYRGSMTYAEPLGKLSRLELNSNVEVRDYDNQKLTSNLNTGVAVLIDSISNIYEYKFTQYRNSLSYRYGSNNSKTTFSLGVTGVNTSLAGTKASLGTNIDKTYFKVIPIARFQFRFSRQHQFSANYNGRAQEPSFDQIQPVRDISNPQNPVVGNPDLKVAFTHSINAQYGNYIANSGLQYQLNMNTSFTDNQVTSTSTLIPDVFGSFKRETRFVNLDGNHTNNVSYNINKAFSNRKYRFQLQGNITNRDQISLVDGQRNEARQWVVNQNLGPQINPATWLEINPYVSYNSDKTDLSLPGINDSRITTWSYSLDGNVYFLKNFQFGYALSKNFISGISGVKSQNPFIANFNLQTRIFKNKAGLQIRAFDLFNQNNFLNRTVSPTNTTEIRTNPVSRYFMVNLSMNLQKWTGASRNGRSPQRRNDGSFVN